MIESDAYAYLELTPDEFHDLTPYEFDRMLEGYNKRDERRLRETAMWVANLMNASGNMKEAVTIDSLLGKGPAQVGQDMEKLRRRAEERRRERLREREKKSGR